jgi:PhnB protein
MTQVKAVPEGYRTVTPFLNIKGCADAIELYKRAFGAEERVRFTTPDGNIAIAELKIGDSIVRVSESVNVPPTQSANLLCVEDAQKWWKRAVDAGCQVTLPLEDRFFGDRFGILTDKYGNRWSIAQHLRDVSMEEMRAATAQMPSVR